MEAIAVDEAPGQYRDPISLSPNSPTSHIYLRLHPSQIPRLLQTRLDPRRPRVQSLSPLPFPLHTLNPSQQPPHTLHLPPTLQSPYPPHPLRASQPRRHQPNTRHLPLPPPPHHLPRNLPPHCHPGQRSLFRGPLRWLGRQKPQTRRLGDTAHDGTGDMAHTSPVPGGESDEGE